MYYLPAMMTRGSYCNECTFTSLVTQDAIYRFASCAQSTLNSVYRLGAYYNKDI